MLKPPIPATIASTMPLARPNGLASNNALSPPKITLSIQEAVAASGLSRSYLYEAMSQGKLPFVKKGKRRLIPAAALAEYVLHSDE